MNKKTGTVGAAFFAVAMILAVIIGVMSIEKVPTGYVGVVYSASKGVTGEVLEQGWHFVSPTKKVTEYSIGIEQSYLTTENRGDSKKDESFNVPTSDGKTVRVDLEFSYKFDAENVANTFTQFKGRSGETVKDTFIKPKVMAWTQEVTAKYPVTDIFGDKRTEINAELDKYLKEKFAPYGIIIDTVNFINISVDEETAQAIQKKVTAQQELELANIEAQTAKVQAEKDKEVALIAAQQEKEKASIVAEQKKIAAEGEADALRIKAEAEADSNRKLAESITDELIRMEYAEKWNGNYPQVMSDATPIISITE